MEAATYNKRAWRELPRDYCVVDLILGSAVAPCAGLIHHHHVDPDDPDSRTLQICNRHHQKIHAVLRYLRDPEKGWRHCSHEHRYPEGRAACERRLNRDLLDAIPS